MTGIIRNAARCKLCNDTIESKHRQDYMQCKCGAIAVDGGRVYIRRIGNASDIEELSQYGDIPGADPVDNWRVW